MKVYFTCLVIICQSFSKLKTVGNVMQRLIDSENVMKKKSVEMFLAL